MRVVRAGIWEFYQLYLSVYPADGGGLSARGLCHVHEYQGDEEFRDVAECDHDVVDRAAGAVRDRRYFSYGHGEPDAVHAAGNVGRVQCDGVPVHDIYRIWTDHDGERGGHRSGEDDPEGDPDLDRGGYRDQDFGVFYRVRDHSLAAAGAGGHEHADDRHGGSYRGESGRLSLRLCGDSGDAFLDQHGGHGVLEDFVCDGAGSAAAESVQGDQQDDENTGFLDRRVLGHRLYRGVDQGSGAHFDSDQYLLADRLQSRERGADHLPQEKTGAGAEIPGSVLSADTSARDRSEPVSDRQSGDIRPTGIDHRGVRDRHWHTVLLSDHAEAEIRFKRNIDRRCA